MKKREIVLPLWMEKSADAVHEDMLHQAPEDINVAEGDFFYDATRPVAEEFTKTINMQLKPALARQFIQTSEGEDLDMRAEEKSIKRHPALYALVTVHFTGKVGVDVPVGTVVHTVSVNNEPAILYKTIEAGVIGSDGTLNLRARATVSGLEGMVDKGTLILLEKSIQGIDSVTNLLPSVGGTPPETDEQLRDRLIQNNIPTYSGCDSDYIRWAKEVAGVGNVYVIPEFQGPDSGTAKVLILDTNGDPANEDIIRAVKTYICPEGKINRPGKAPVDARITIEAPVLHKINISAKLIFDFGINEDEVRRLVERKIKEYLVEIQISPDGTEKVLISRVGAAIMSIKGIKDYQNLELNGVEGDNAIPRLNAVGLGMVKWS